MIYPGQEPTAATINRIANSTTRERDHNCIEMHLKNLEAELTESLNSAANLADKLRGSQPSNGDCPAPPQPSDITSRLASILDTVRSMNQQLGRAHSAISG